MANKCNPCSDNVFKRLSSNPDIADLLGAAGKPHNIEGDGQYIFVSTVETDDLKTDTISYSPYIPLTINSFTDDQALLLKGFTLTDYQLDWVYNKTVETHSLDNGLTAPTVTAGLTYSLPVTGASITTDTTIQLTADDNTGDANPAKTANTSILFGNYIYQTQIAISDRNDIDEALINGLTLVNLPKTITRNRNLTFACLSEAGEYEVLLVPSSYALDSGTLFKDVATQLTGGWGQLISDISLTNEEGFSENYDVLVSSNKELVGLSFQIL